MKTYIRRREKLCKDMREQNVDALFITASPDMTYLTGWRLQPAQRMTSLVIIGNAVFLLAPAIECRGLKADAQGICTIPWSDIESPLKKVAALLPADGTIALGSDMRASWVLEIQGRLPRASWVNADRLLVLQRRIKSEQELQILREAQSMAERTLEKLYRQGVCGRTERATAQLLTELRLQEGFEPVGSSVVASGPNSALPHQVNTDRRIVRGDVLVLNIAGCHKGYYADLTRTCAVGKADGRFREIYELVLRAHLAARDAVRPGVTCGAVDSAAREIIRDAGYGEYFPHRLGHGIGLQVDEAPFIIADSREVLAQGNVVSNEPGIYLPGYFGVRIEDVLVVTQSAGETLNTMSNQLRVIR